MHRRASRRAFLIVALAVLAGMLTGCGGGSSSSSASSGSSGAGGDHRGGTMVLAWNGIGSSIDPAVDYDQNWTLLWLLYDAPVARVHSLAFRNITEIAHKVRRKHAALTVRTIAGRRHVFHDLRPHTAASI